MQVFLFHRRTARGAADGVHHAEVALHAWRLEDETCLVRRGPESKGVNGMWKTAANTDRTTGFVEIDVQLAESAESGNPRPRNPSSGPWD